MPTVLLSTPAPATADDLRAMLAGAGFEALAHSLGSSPGVDFGPVAVAVIEVGEQANAAVAQTRRWRAELGDELVPILWLIPHADPLVAARGLDAGADAVLAWPLDPVQFAAQLRAAARSRAVAARVATRAAEARLLGEQLNRAFSQLDRELAAAQRLRRAFLPRDLPTADEVRFAVCHHPRNRHGGDFYDVRRLTDDTLGFFLADATGPGTVGNLLGVLIRRAVTVHGWGESVGRVTPPGELLAAVNRELLDGGGEDHPLVAMLAGTVNVRTGHLAIARAGLPAPVYVPSAGETESWVVPGPFLGVAESSYWARTASLRGGDKLLIGTDGTRPEGDPGPAEDATLIQTASRHRDLTGQAFVDAVARDLLLQVQHDDDFTLMCLEFGSGSPSADPV